MTKTKNFSIRFDKADLKICFLHSNKKTAQKLVDWLCRNYADIYRVKEINPFISETPKMNVTNFSKTKKINVGEQEEIDSIKQISNEIKDAKYFYKKMKELDKDDTDAVMKLSEEANESMYLTFNEKRDIRTALQNGTY